MINISWKLFMDRYLYYSYFLSYCFSLKILLRYNYRIEKNYGHLIFIKYLHCQFNQALCALH